MKNILFTHSYFYKFDSKQWKTQQPYPPLGTIFAASVMREAGYKVNLFDVALRDSPDEILPILKEQQPKFLVIYDDGFNYLTKMCLTTMREAAHKLAEYGKQHGCTIIVASSDSTDHFDKYLDNHADFIILGEAEMTLLELCNHIVEGGTTFDEVKGLAFRKGTETHRTPKRAILRKLDTLPMPAWDLIDMSGYREIWQQGQGYFSLNIATTRGCPFKCNWCAKPIYGNRYNSRSPEQVVNEIAYLMEHHKPDHFWMCDDIFGLKPRWVQTFRDLLKERGLSIRYKIQSRVDLLLKEDTIEALAQSGLQTVWVGAESGSQKILDAMDKGTKVEQIREATRLLKSKGVRVGFFLQFGYLGETREDIQKTIDLLLDCMPDDIGISVSYPLPGTKFYDKVKAELGEKANWVDSDDLDMMYTGTFAPEYYKRLHRYVHKVFRRQQGLNTIKEGLKQPLALNAQQIRSALGTLYYAPTALIDKYRLFQLSKK